MTTPAADSPSTSDRPSRRGAPRRRRTGRWILLSLAVLVLAGAGTAYWLYSGIDGNIKGVDIDRAIGDDRPEKLPTSGQNILILGSDSRAGANAKLDNAKVSGARSDTALVMHIPRAARRPSRSASPATPW